MKVKDLVKALQGKDQEKEVEFIVCGTDSEIIAMKIERKASDIAKLLKLFKR